MTTKTSAIIPAYNEAERIQQTIQAVWPYVDEILVIDDASLDDTAACAETAGARVLRQPKNQGYIQAIKAGFQAARGEFVITIDADGEFPAEAIPELVQPLVEDRADMVQGHRDQVPRFSEKFLTRLAQLKGPVGDSGTGLRALRTSLAQKLDLRGACICGIFSLEVIANQGRISEIPIKLRTISKPRRIAWYHIQQFFYLLPWLLRKIEH